MIPHGILLELIEQKAQKSTGKQNKKQTLLDQQRVGLEFFLRVNQTNSFDGETSSIFTIEENKLRAEKMLLDLMGIYKDSLMVL